MPFRQCLRAGLPQLAAASHPPLGAASQPQLGAGAAQGAAATAQGAAASHPQLGAVSQLLFLWNLPCKWPFMPFSLWPSCNLGRQAGVASQLGAGASQQTGAESQPAFFLQSKPAEALDDEIAAKTTTVKVMINRRMELTPKKSKSFVNRAVNFWPRNPSEVSPVATLSRWRLTRNQLSKHYHRNCEWQPSQKKLPRSQNQPRRIATKVEVAAIVRNSLAGRWGKGRT